MAELQLLDGLEVAKKDSYKCFCKKNQSRNQHFLAMDEELDVASAHGLFVVSTKRARKERSADEQRTQGRLIFILALDAFNV